MSMLWPAVILAVAILAAIAVSYLRDRSLQTRVQGALGHALGVQAISILVRSRAGRIVLYGVGPTGIDVERAMDVAYAVDGVASVRSA